MNGGFDRKVTDKWFIFQPAMFDFRRVDSPVSYDLTLGQAFEDSVGRGYADPSWLGLPSHITASAEGSNSVSR